MGKLNGHAPNLSHFTGKKGNFSRNMNRKKKVRTKSTHVNKYANAKKEIIKWVDNDKQENTAQLNIVFLDVDGELTYSNYRNEETANIDIEKVKLLKEICDKGNAKVVISSSWRGYGDYTPKIYNVLLSILRDHQIEVIDKTPYLPTEFKETASTDTVIYLNDLDKLHAKFGTGRAAEIQRWLDEHDVTNFVILDDEDWDWCDYGFDAHWIQPTWLGDGGLKREHVDKAIEILTKSVI